MLDAFHVTRLGFAAVDDVRRRVQHETTGHRGRRDDPLYRIRRVLRRGADNLSDRAWERLLAGLAAGDDGGQIAASWIAAQDLRLLYRCADRAQAQPRMHRWLVHCADSDVPELHRLARTIDSWRPELLAYFDTGGISNRRTEAVIIWSPPGGVFDVADGPHWDPWATRSLERVADVPDVASLVG